MGDDVATIFCRADNCCRGRQLSNSCRAGRCCHGRQPTNLVTVCCRAVSIWQVTLSLQSPTNKYWHKHCKLCHGLNTWWKHQCCTFWDHFSIKKYIWKLKVPIEMLMFFGCFNRSNFVSCIDSRPRVGLDCQKRSRSGFVFEILQK